VISFYLLLPINNQGKLLDNPSVLLPERRHGKVEAVLEKLSFYYCKY